MNNAKLSTPLARLSAEVVKNTPNLHPNERETFVLDYELMDNPPSLERTSGGKTKRRKSKHTKSRKKIKKIKISKR